MSVQRPDTSELRTCAWCDAPIPHGSLCADHLAEVRHEHVCGGDER